MIGAFVLGMITGGLWMFAGFFVAHKIGEANKPRIEGPVNIKHACRNALSSAHIAKSQGRF